MVAKEEIRDIVAGQLGVPVDSIDFDADLVNAGMN
jgi:acyl carrier protein